MSSRESYLVANTLVSLLKCVEGRMTTVELRNENVVTGMIVEVDAFMNVTMSDVVFKTYTGKERKFSQFYIQGRHIRYVQIPDEINMKRALETRLNRATMHREKIRKDVQEASWRKIQKKEKEYQKAEVLKERQRKREQETNRRDTEEND